MNKFKEINEYLKKHTIADIDSLVVKFPKAFVNPPKGEHYILTKEEGQIRLTYVNRKRRVRIERIIKQ